MKAKFILLFVVSMATTAVFSQSTKKFIDSGSVSHQFDNLIKNSNRYQEYKVVKKDWLFKLKSNVTDSISGYKKELSSTYTTINSQNKSVDSLKLALDTSKDSISNLSGQIESISLFGIQFKKGTFKTILFSIIGLLAVLLIAFISKFKQSNTITTEVKNSLSELDEEFETHRKKALEREQKVRRQLQDELNKHKKE